MSRGRLGAYAVWQMRDYALNRGLPTLIVGALLYLQIHLLGSEIGRVMSPARLAGLIASVLAPFVFIGSLIAVNGIISNDRRQGHFRFLFAKPVSIPRYYLQAFLLHGAGVVAATALFLLAVRWGAGIETSARTLLYPAVYFALLGGIGFLYSAILRTDWVLIAATLALSEMAHWRWGDEAGLRGFIADWLLPPFYRFAGMREDLVAGVVPNLLDLLHPVAYGAIAVLLAVSVLRRRPIGE